jgi:hypothetical protein
MNWKHDDLAADLAAHLRGASDRLIWTDMQLGPSGSPRPDVYAVPCSFARFQPIAYECKISVSDFRRDVTAGKWTSYLRYAAGVIFAAPAGLIRKEDIPQGCGLMLRGDAGWRTVKGPTLKNVDNLPRDAWIKLLIDGISRIVNSTHDQMRAQLANEWKVEARVRESLGNAVADAVRDVRYGEMRLQNAKRQLEEAAADAEQERRLIMDRARERAHADAQLVDTSRAELAVALGLPPTARAYEIAHACADAARRLSENTEIDRLQRHLNQVRKALDSAADPLPHIAQVAA